MKKGLTTVINLTINTYVLRLCLKEAKYDVCKLESGHVVSHLLSIQYVHKYIRFSSFG